MAKGARGGWRRALRPGKCRTRRVAGVEARALGDIVSMESNEWRVSVELVQQWRWRCLEEGILVPGSDLCVANPGSGHMVRLTESVGDAVPRNDLRHSCGSRVLPVTPLEAK